ncbi:MAG: SIP domain-containing protein [Microthrixaceae bacterium]
MRHACHRPAAGGHGSRAAATRSGDRADRGGRPQRPACAARRSLDDGSLARPPRGAPPGEALCEEIERLEDVPGTAWVAGEAAAMQRIRRHLFEERGHSRSQATVRGYWKLGRSATSAP